MLLVMKRNEPQRSAVEQDRSMRLVRNQAYSMPSSEIRLSVMSDRRFGHEDALGPARGVINGLLLSAVLWVLALGGYWVWVNWLAR